MSVNDETNAGSVMVVETPHYSAQFHDHASELAKSHQTHKDPGKKPFLLSYLNEYEKHVRHAVQYFRGATDQELAVSYAAEWILDNYYIVLQALRQVEEDMPSKYYRQLPKLLSGDLKGYPRIYSVAREIVLQKAALLDLDEIKKFVNGYEMVQPLSMGELWALPVMLRLSVIQALVVSLIKITNIKTSLSGEVAAVIDLKEMVSSEEVVANSIISLRMLAAVEWKDFFENLSLVEMILQKDPAGYYEYMDFETRDSYRKVIEEIAWRLEAEETVVAQEAVRQAERASHQNQNSRRAHVGYYLLDRGRLELEAALGFQPSLSLKASRWIFAHPTFVYLGGIAGVTSAILAALLFYAMDAGANLLHLVGIILLSLVPALSVAVDFINWIITNSVKPRVVPKLDFSKGISSELCTALVVPTILADEGDVQPLLRQMEQHYISNQDPNLYLVVLSDFSDWQAQEKEGDEKLVQELSEGINALNDRYRRSPQPPFILLHRERHWNLKEDVWMGWERKRGKLQQFNKLVLGDPPTNFRWQAGPVDALYSVRYVITLDTDTILPRRGANKLVGTLAHPLNRAEFDAQTGEIISGYTVLQPRTEINPSVSNHSLFTRIFAGDTGLDLYTLAVSDVYQDLFAEGIYVGKGIYDVYAFEHSLSGRVPENALLSHDLFEGILGRVALVTDIVLIEDYPPHYLLFTLRMHRWLRGDWQLLPWLFPIIPAHPDSQQIGQSSKHTRTANPLSAIDRWKILDNLRRSLLAPTLLLFFVFGWVWFPGSALLWTTVGLLSLSLPFLTSFLGSVWDSLRSHAPVSDTRRAPLRLDWKSAARWFMALVFLPFEALIALDAILTTLERLYVTQRGLLQWTTAAQMTRELRMRLSAIGIIQQMGVSLTLSLALMLLIILISPDALLLAAPLLLLWVLAPQIAYRISEPIIEKPSHLPEQDRIKLRRLARRTWLFFEQYLGPEDHWLPPDHFQEHPRGVIAHRTSPTNIGLALTSILSAYDLGYLGLLDMASRLRSVLETLEKLEKYRGHFLNWYDTRSLEPLPPRYASTVDSGNMAASLVALGQGCLQTLHTPVLRWEIWQGLLDTLDLLLEPMDKLVTPETTLACKALEKHLLDVRSLILAVKDDPSAWTSLAVDTLGYDTWDELDRRLLALVEVSSSGLDPDILRRLGLYARSVRTMIDSARRELELLLPWIPAAARVPDFLKQQNLSGQLALDTFFDLFPVAPTLLDLINFIPDGQAQLVEIQESLHQSDGENSQVQKALDWCAALSESLQSAKMAAKVLRIAYQDIHRQCEGLVQEMDFSFLFDSQRQVFHIGLNIDLGRLDNNYYDLLASEARIASLIAIAKGDVPYSHWLHLSRPLTQTQGSLAILSWSATMFEYLMPLLFFRSYQGTLLHQTAHAAVDHHIAYGQQRSVPWGISESGYYRFDPNMNYQYRAFGVPGLGYKRGLHEDLVITPYASLLALPLRPVEVLKNLDELDKFQMLGTYGYYEALDFTLGRLALGDKYQIVRSYMAHHQGMILVSLVNYLKSNPMVERTHSDPLIQSVELLLQEQLPQGAPLEQMHLEEQRGLRPQAPKVVAEPWRVRVRSPQPRLHYLSNGRFSVMVTSSGSGFSTWQDMDLTRWRADTTLNDLGTYIYVQDMDSGSLWSATHQPTANENQHNVVNFSPHMAHLRSQNSGISLEMDITVSPDDDVEIRNIVLTNTTGVLRRIRLVSYAEVILAPHTNDEKHPAFNKLFIQSEYDEKVNALIFRRRPRSDDDEPIYVAHGLFLPQMMTPSAEYETDRARFIGRGRNPRSPAALDPVLQSPGSTILSRSVGATLDPIMSLGQEVELAPHSSLELAYLTAAARSRESVLALIQRYQASQPISRAFDQARSVAELELRQMNLSSPKLAQIQRLLSLLLFPHSILRASPDVLAANQKGQPGLWAYGISGDYPLLLVRVYEQDHLGLVQELLQAHTYWRSRRLMIDLVFVNEQGTDYGQELNKLLFRLMDRTKSDSALNQRGGIFVILADRLKGLDRALLESTARVVLDGRQGTLEEQLARMQEFPVRLPAFQPSLSEPSDTQADTIVDRPRDLLFDNDLGGFSQDGREYQIYLEPGSSTPAPWVNIVANPDFGFLVTESGSSFTWAINSGENRLTPWSNDPVSDPSGEALYLRDEETGQVWTPTPLPAGADKPYLVRHGAGYTIFEHHSQGLKQRLRHFGSPTDPVKIIQLRLENTRPRLRRLTATCFVEWVLGISREAYQQFIIPEYHDGPQALLARNPYHEEFGERVAFLASSRPLHGLTSDREEFLGRTGSRAYPSGLHRIGLSGNIQPGSDPAAVLQVHIDLEAGEIQEFHFVLGQGASREQSIDLIRRYSDPAAAEDAWQATVDFWDEILQTVQVSTPEPAMDLMLNRWLLYQALACRIWGRSGFYQSSGAYGFRDQLQDVMSLVHAAPHLARQHILRSARHQFDAGDVLHWWHPPSGRGVRTRYSDDLLWLPYVTAFYVEATGDESVLDEKVPFLTGPVLEPTEKERYGRFEKTATEYTIYEHCRRALEKGSSSGRHKLPLMGSGDWNDGMNRVGIKGKGESVWLAWFLYETQMRFARLCERRSETTQAEIYRSQAADLAQAIEEAAWDGDWYLRAFYDDGTPLGSSGNNECQIDSIAQSWSVISGAANPQRANRALQSVSERLLLPEDRLLLLFAPPFDKTSRDPGYIKGYLPGIRENGGQYTHAAIWTVWAYTILGDGDYAEELFRCSTRSTMPATLMMSIAIVLSPM
jgi:cyclic beta-1,2-glucan synthetase